MRSRPFPIFFPLFLAGSVAGTGLGLGACSGTGANPRSHLEVPNAVSGGTRGGGRPDSPSLERMAEGEAAARQDREKTAAEERTEKEQQAETLWTNALAKQARDPEDAADDFRELAEDHPTSPHAEEARWLAADGYFRAGEWNETIAILEEYLKTNPVNPHLPQVERMLYESSLKVFARAQGFSGVFRSRTRGYDGLKAIVERVPQGAYADDALLALGDQYVSEQDYETAALQYRNLLLRYPDSEWSFRARLKLGDAYLARDQGRAYHAGFVDLDPRNPVTPQASATRPVRSVVEAAAEQYQAFLDRLAADPARRAEYANEIAYAERKIAECRVRLAEKNQVISGWYGGRGQGEAATAYQRFATNEAAGRPWCEGMPTAPVGSSPAAGVAPRTGPPAPPPITPTTGPVTRPIPGTSGRVGPPVVPPPAPPPTLPRSVLPPGAPPPAPSPTLPPSVLPPSGQQPTAQPPGVLPPVIQPPPPVPAQPIQPPAIQPPVIQPPPPSSTPGLLPPPRHLPGSGGTGPSAR